ncbi:methyl-accepting chemotaxis protein [Fusibacter sp. 3D3]|uniref:methyl-accepting chemotaxis protein n=1 Tax=Fusibacter sp. 3D3 TaxID=1048380 RepID=UPI000853256C|nr:methyl-accepting chemotaxis protein [Fusibacter sp. 3D3]GAU76445.1 methyl-accepting chemotaxis protein [Fusibacter sp. 3D3]
MVANEVRKLAEQSSDATSEIQSTIGEIEKLIANTQNMMDVTLEKSKDSKVLIEESSHIFSDIEKSAKEVSGSIESLSVYNVLVVESMNQVLNAIENISAVTEESAAAAEQVSATAQLGREEVKQIIEVIKGLNELITELDRSVSLFKI